MADILDRLKAALADRFSVGSYDITADDQHFLMRRLAIGTDEEVGDTLRLILVQNWFEELKAKMGPGND